MNSVAEVINPSATRACVRAPQVSSTDTFSVYVRAELDHWGFEFALHRDCEYLGHVSRNMLQVLIEHRGEMPPPNTGYKPFETDLRAQKIEDIVADIARSNAAVAICLRAYHCGSGRRRFERWETANLLLANADLPMLRQMAYLNLAAVGRDDVCERLIGRRAAEA